MRAVVGLGSNLGDSVALMRMAAQCFKGQVVAASSIFSTPPWGVTDQPNFLNAVMILDTDLSPEQLLKKCQTIEQQAHRVRERHWGPRTLDLDIVDIEGFHSAQPHLQVPHPYAHQRAFVLIPWLDADPDGTLNGVAVRSLIAQLPAEECAGVVDTGQALMDLRDALGAQVGRSHRDG